MPRKEILDRTQKYTQPFRITKGESFQLKNYDPGDTCGLKLDKGEANTYWKLTRLGELPVTAVSQQEPLFVLNSETHRVSGSGGGNRLTGSYELKDDHLTFSQMATTMTTCAEGMDTEKAFLGTNTRLMVVRRVHGLRRI